MKKLCACGAVIWDGTIICDTCFEQRKKRETNPIQEGVLTTFWINENWKAWVVTDNLGNVLTVEIAEYKITPSMRHEIIQEYRQANEHKPKVQGHDVFHSFTCEVLERANVEP